jgi:hypothetical protein
MRRILLSMSMVVLAACGGGSSSTSNGISQTFTSSASIGEMIDFTIDTDKKTYSYTITQSSYGLSGTTGSGTLISNADGSYSPSNQSYSKIHAVKNGLLVGSVNLPINGTAVNVPIYGTSSPIKTLASLAGTYNYVSSTCTDNTTGQRCGTTSYGTVKVLSSGNYTQCFRNNITAMPACSDATGTISYIANGIWKYQRTGSTNPNYLIAFSSSNGQNVFITDFNDPGVGGYGYGQAIGSTQSPVDTTGSNNGTYFSHSNAATSAVTQVTGLSFVTQNYYSDGRNTDSNTGLFTVDQPWIGMFEATGNNGNSMGILAGTGAFVARSTVAGQEWYYMVGLKK